MSDHHDLARSKRGPTRNWNILRLWRRRHHDPYHVLAGTRSFAEFADLLEIADSMRERGELLASRNPRHLHNLLNPKQRHKAAYEKLFGTRSFADAACVCHRVALRVAFRRELFDDTTTTFRFVRTRTSRAWLVVPPPERVIPRPVPA